MKKLLTIAALAACLVPAFAEDVTSANVVGYQKISLGTGFNWVAPQFLNVGDQEISIKCIELKFADGVEASGVDNMQILDEGGATLTTYTWFPADWFGGDKDGWVDENGNAVDVVIPAGKSILLDIVDEGTSVVVDGEVSETDYVTTAVAGFNFVGNTTPVTINLQEVLLDFGEGEASGVDNIQTLDDGGATLATYTWFPADWFGGEEDGWVDENGNPVANVTFAPGQGFLVDIVDDGTTITVPAAL